MSEKQNEENQKEPQPSDSEKDSPNKTDFTETSEKNGTEQLKNQQTEPENKQIEPNDDERGQIKEKKVILHAEAYKSIILYATRYANASINRSEWREIYGILVGVHSDDAVIIERAIPMTYGESHDVELNAQHYGFIAEIQDKLDAEGKGRFMVGWFHSHPGLSLFYSYVDIINQISFQQANPDFMGIVFDHTYLLGKEQRPNQYENHPSQFNPGYIIDEKHPNHPFHTGMVCYRINDPYMDQNNIAFDNNYHDTEFEILGLDQFFFANLLTELSGYAAAGNPLEKAYKEPLNTQKTSTSINSEPPQSQNGVMQNLGWKQPEKNNQINQEKISLKEIPKSNLNEENAKINFSSQPTGNDPNVPQLSSIPGVEIGSQPNTMSSQETDESKIDKLLTEGKTAFYINDSFTAIEKYQEAIKILQEKGEESSEKILNILLDASEGCLRSNHENMALKFAQKLKMNAEAIGDMFQMGNADYLTGSSMISKGDIQEGLEALKNSAVLYENAGDFAGVGKVNEDIANIYLDNNDLTSGSLFLVEAMKNYSIAKVKFHRKRRSTWALPAKLSKTISDLKDKVISYLPDIETKEIVAKIQNDLNEI